MTDLVNVADPGICDSPTKHCWYPTRKEGRGWGVAWELSSWTFNNKDKQAIFPVGIDTVDSDEAR